MPSVIIIASCGNEEVVNPTQESQVGKKVFESEEAFKAFKRNYNLAEEEVVEVKTISSSTKIEQDYVPTAASSTSHGSFLTPLFSKRSTSVDLKSLEKDGELPLGTTSTIATAMLERFRSDLFRKYFSDNLQNYDKVQNIFCLEISPYKVFYKPSDLQAILNAGYQISLMINDYPELKQHSTDADTRTADKLFVDYVHLCMEQAQKVFFAKEELYTRCRDDVEQSEQVTSSKAPGLSRKNLFSGRSDYKGFIGEGKKPVPSLTNLNSKAFKFDDGEFSKAVEVKMGAKKPPEKPKIANGKADCFTEINADKKAIAASNAKAAPAGIKLYIFIAAKIVRYKTPIPPPCKAQAYCGRFSRSRQPTTCKAMPDKTIPARRSSIGTCVCSAAYLIKKLTPINKMTMPERTSVLPPNNQFFA
jgi:hypothetical protein